MMNRDADKTVRDIRRATRRKFSAEEKIRIVLEDPAVVNPARGTALCVKRFEYRLNFTPALIVRAPKECNVMSR